MTVLDEGGCGLSPIRPDGTIRETVELWAVTLTREVAELSQRYDAQERRLQRIRCRVDRDLAELSQRLYCAERLRPLPCRPWRAGIDQCDWRAEHRGLPVPRWWVWTMGAFAAAAVVAWFILTVWGGR